MNAVNTQPTQYLLHPRAPLVFGAGKPLDFGLGGDSLNFPFPTTVAAALRAAHSCKSGGSADPYASINGLQLQQLALARFNWLDEREAPTLMLPRPADAVYLNGKMLPLVPKRTPEGCWTDLAAGLQPLELQGEDADKKGKPDAAPQWWAASDYCEWLKGNEGQTPFTSPGDLSVDERTHVVIDPDGKGAIQGGLFRSSGRDFGVRSTGAAESSTQAHAIAIAVQEPQSLNGEIRRLGGEGRFVRFESRTDASLWQALKPPEGIEKATLIRFVLTTPAVFEGKGWHPDSLALDPSDQTIKGNLTIQGYELQVQLVAAAISRSLSYSGWQIGTGENAKPGPGRPWRVVPAGSVYWLRVTAGDAPKLWGQSLCSNSKTVSWLDNGWGRGLVGLAERALNA